MTSRNLPLSARLLHRVGRVENNGATGRLDSHELANYTDPETHKQAEKDIASEKGGGSLADAVVDAADVLVHGVEASTPKAEAPRNMR